MSKTYCVEWKYHSVGSQLQREFFGTADEALAYFNELVDNCYRDHIRVRDLTNDCVLAENLWK